MIFAIWCIAWVIVASNACALLFPIIAVIIRSAYHRNLRFVTIPSVLVFAFSFLVYSVTPDLPPEKIVTNSVKVLASALLVTHLAAMFAGVRKDWLPRTAAIFLHQYPRCVRIVRERLDDFRYSMAARIRVRGFHSLPKRLWLFCQVLGNFFAELARVERQLDLIMRARGIFPHPREFETKTPPSRSVVVGDVCLLLIAFVFVLFGPERAVPGPLAAFLRPITKLIAQN